MPFTRVTAIWTGAPGLPGYSRFHFTGMLNTEVALAAAQNVRAFFFNNQVLFPAAVTITVQATAEHFDDTGTLVGIVSYAAVNPVVGEGTQGYSAASGACVTWLTSSFVGGRGVRGRTFLVPLHAGNYQTDGTMNALAILQGAADDLAAAAPVMDIISRPATGNVVISDVTGALVADKAAILRSRRD
jgi:hypothetical protein